MHLIFRLVTADVTLRCREKADIIKVVFWNLPVLGKVGSSNVQKISHGL